MGQRRNMTKEEFERVQRVMRAERAAIQSGASQVDIDAAMMRAGWEVLDGGRATGGGK